MSFTFQQQATPASITTTTSGTATFANAPQSGEMVVAVLAINSSTATITPPTGFVAKNEYKNTSRTLGIYWKKAGAGESTGFTFTFSASVSGTIIMRRYSSSIGWDTDQSGGATDKVWDSTGTVSQVSLNLTTTLNRLVVGIGYASNTSAGNKQLNPNSGWSDNTLQYSSRVRSAHRTAAGGSEALGYQLTDSTLDNRLAFMVAEFVEYALKNAVASNKTLALEWNDRRYSDPSKVPAQDTTPAAFTFTDQTGVALSSTITSAAITVSGINSAATITSSGGTFDINSSGTFISSGTVNNGDTVRARVTSSASNSTAANCVVTIGGVSDTFTVTTLATIVNIPTSFSASVSSTTITLSWTDANSGAAQTVIERSTDAGATWSALATVAAGTNVYANTGLSAGSYSYRARALIAGTYSSYTSTASATVSASDPYVPRAPNGSDIYVDFTAGTNGSGTSGSPYNTLTQAILRTLTAGQQLVVKGTGAYPDSTGCASGTSGNRIVIRSWPGYTCKFTISGSGARLGGGNYWDVYNLAVDCDQIGFCTHENASLSGGNNTNNIRFIDVVGTQLQTGGDNTGIIWCNSRPDNILIIRGAYSGPLGTGNSNGSLLWFDYATNISVIGALLDGSSNPIYFKHTDVTSAASPGGIVKNCIIRRAGRGFQAALNYVQYINNAFDACNLGLDENGGSALPAGGNYCTLTHNTFLNCGVSMSITDTGTRKRTNNTFRNNAVLGTGEFADNPFGANSNEDQNNSFDYTAVEGTGTNHYYRNGSRYTQAGYKAAFPGQEVHGVAGTITLVGGASPGNTPANWAMSAGVGIAAASDGTDCGVDATKLLTVN